VDGPFANKTRKGMETFFEGIWGMVYSDALTFENGRQS
jgi:hypothetical protein